ncbi:MAG: hypothetical protein NC131_15625, partial [Roseburia sp.]|nr:hypothetical protein [Roseburia sp.]
MFAYWIGGNDYNQILVNIHKDKDTPVVEQFYVSFGNIVKRSKVMYRVGYNEGSTLTSIVTEDNDTVILPKGLFSNVGAYAVTGCKFKRLVVPLNMPVRCMSKALYGSDTLCDFLSLSRNVRY